MLSLIRTAQVYFRRAWNFQPNGRDGLAVQQRDRTGKDDSLLHLDVLPIELPELPCGG